MTSVPSRTAHLSLSAAAVALGLSVTGGWLLQAPALVTLRAGALPLVFNTGVGFLLAGTTALLLQRPERAAVTWRRTALIALVGLAIATLTEIVFELDLGIDMVGVHAWLDYGNTRPGRMAPNTALGFLLIGCAAWLGQDVRTKRRALLVVVLCFAVLTVGLTGIAGYMLAPDLLFGWAKSARMAVPTAFGMIACALAYGFAWNDTWFASRQFFREDEKIRLLGAATVVVMTVTVGLTGFVVLQSSLEKTLSASLSNIFHNRTAWLKTLATEQHARASAAVRLSGFENLARADLQQRTGSSAPLGAVARRLVEGAFRGVALTDATGKVFAQFGRFTNEPPIRAKLDGSGRVEMIWDDALVLRHRIAIDEGGRSLGAILMDTEVPAPEETLFDVSSLGRTGEVNACVLQGVAVLCFPGSGHTQPFTTARSTPARLRPMELALRGEEGVVMTIDYRKSNVVAAYGEIHGGLGLVVKQDTKEVYAPIREALKTGAPIILLVAVAGAALLYLQLNPLARRLWKLERSASVNAFKARAIMAATGDGIITTTPQGDIEDMNAAARRLFGHPPTNDPVAMHCLALSPVAGRKQNLRQLLRATRAAARQEAPACVELWGARRDGSVFPLELTITQVPVGDSHLFVGVLRDITLRKEEQRRLVGLTQFDALTGLPNRSLFRDRLKTAAWRSAREQSAFALLFLDLDGFKQVNDSLGHQAGDRLLKDVAQRLALAVRKTDTVARLSGDEFTVVLENLAHPTTDAQDIARKIVSAVRAPFRLDGATANVTVSVGLVIHDPRDGAADIDQLLKDADMAMYQAKRRGKDRVRTVRQRPREVDDDAVVASVFDTLW